jgi:hypothetical protein
VDAQNFMERAFSPDPHMQFFLMTNATNYIFYLLSAKAAKRRTKLIFRGAFASPCDICDYYCLRRSQAERFFLLFKGDGYEGAGI